jgi:hypothetical protein
MNTENLLPLPAEIPLGFSHLMVSADEMDYLKSHWGLKDHGEIFNWAIKMLYDLSKLDEAGWRLSLTKAEIDETTKKIVYHPDYRQIHFIMKWLKPMPEGFARLPVAETLDEVMRVKKPQE